MVTLGLWDGETASAFMQGSTFLHELGHTLCLKHGGVNVSGALPPPHTAASFSTSPDGA